MFKNKVDKVEQQEIHCQYGTRVEFNGDEVPANWKKVDNDWVEVDLSDNENFEPYTDASGIVYKKSGDMVNIVGTLKPKKEDNVLNSATETLVMELPERI